MKEFGSHFHWVKKAHAGAPPRQWHGQPARFYGSGRMALAALLDWGSSEQGWRRLWIPSYYCEPVVSTLASCPLELRRYACGPEDEVISIPEVDKNDVLVMVSCFGWGFPAIAGEFPGAIVADCSHDLAALREVQLQKIRCDYAFASLRKTLPLPDGGVLTATGHGNLPKPPESRDDHQAVTSRRMAAMLLKSAGLADGCMHKSLYRQLEIESEAAYDRPGIASISEYSLSWLQPARLKQWQQARASNWRALRGRLVELENIEWLSSGDADRAAYAVLRCKDATHREGLRKRLIEKKVYPAILWPPPPGRPDWYRPRDRAFSETTLCLHVDGRYQPRDMNELARRVGEAVTAAGLTE